MVSQGTQKRSSRRKAKGQRSPLSTSGVLKLPQKMVHAVGQHHKEGQCRLALGAARRRRPGPDTKQAKGVGASSHSNLQPEQEGLSISTLNAQDQCLSSQQREP